MTSTNDGKEVKSNQTSGQKGKKYFISLFHSLEEHLSGACDTSERTQYVCEAWRLVHSLCLNSTANTHPHLLSWVQRHTAHVILQDEWRLPENKKQHVKLEAAINDFIVECHASSDSPVWEAPLLRRALWFKRILPDPWGHAVLKALLHKEGQQPTDEEVIQWLREERGMMLVTRLRLMARARLADLALVLAAAVMSRVRRVTPPPGDSSTHADVADVPPSTSKEPTLVDVLSREAGFTKEVWELLVDIEFALLHKLDHAKCIDLAKKIPLKDGQQIVERLRNRLDKSPADKKLWKKAKDVAILIAQVIITRCMVLPRCAGDVRDALAGCAGALAQLLPRARLPADADAMARPAASAAHLYTFAEAIAQQCKGDRKPFVCLLYVRAITAGMNELERLKLEKEKEESPCGLQRTLSEWFSQLGEVLATSARLRCECLLTAFSVHPAADMYERVRALPPLASAADAKQDSSEQVGENNSEFGSWACDSRTRTNYVKTSETLNLKQTQKHANILSSSIFDTECEALGLSTELCEDLAVLLSGPRVKTLSWDMDRDTLLENCRIYMERTQEGTRVLTTELKYLNLDPKTFEHLPEEAEDENDNYGIEKGYEQSLEYEDLWTDDLIDYPERCDSVCSVSTTDSSYVVLKHKPRKSRKICSDDERDPLRIETDFNDGNKEESKKCLQNDNKEKQSDLNKKKHGLKVNNKQPKQPLSEIDKEKELLKKQKRKERRELKKKEKMLLLQGKTPSTVQQPPHMLSRLVGLKIANAPETTRIQHVSFTDSDYDSQGKSSLASINSEGNDPDVLFDGLFSMDEIRSPENSTSNSSYKAGSKPANNYDSNVPLHGKSTDTKSSQLSRGVSKDKLHPHNASTSNVPNVNQQKQMSKTLKFDQSYESREIVKMNLKKLLQYRQQRRLNDHIRNSQKLSNCNESITPTKPVGNVYRSECPGMSQTHNTGIPYTQVEDNSKLDERSGKPCGDYKNSTKPIQISNSVDYIRQSTLLKQKSKTYNNVNKTNNKPLIATTTSIKNKDTASQKQFQDFVNKTNNNPSIAATICNKNEDSPSQKQFQDYVSKTNNKPSIAATICNKNEDSPSQKQFQAFLNKQNPVLLQTSNFLSDPNQKQYQQLTQKDVSVELKSNKQAPINLSNINIPQHSLNNRGVPVMSYSNNAQNNSHCMPNHNSAQPLKGVPIRNYSTFFKDLNKNKSVSNIVNDGVKLEQKTAETGKTKKQLKHQHTRAENVPNTFSRLSYMHKNKQADMKSKQSNEQPHKQALRNSMFSQVPGNTNDAYEKINNLQTRGEIVISKTQQLNNKGIHRTDSRMLVKQGENIYCPSKTTNVQTEVLQKIYVPNVAKPASEASENKIKILNDEKAKAPINIQYILQNQSDLSTSNKWKSQIANTTIERKKTNVPISVCNLYKDDKVVMLGVTNKEVKHKTTAVQKGSKIVSKSKLHGTSDNIKDHGDHSGIGKVNTEDWESVMNAIRALKTPNRGLDGQDVFMNKETLKTLNSETVKNFQSSFSNSTVNVDKIDTKDTNMNFKRSMMTNENGPIQIVSSNPKMSTNKVSKNNTSHIMCVEQTKLLSNKSLKSSNPITIMHNSDYDQLDDLIDDDLRQEIEESSPLNSEEDSYRSVAGTAIVSEKEQESKNILSTHKVKAMHVNNLNHNLQETSQRASISRPKLHINSDPFLHSYRNMAGVNLTTLDYRSNVCSNVAENSKACVNMNPIPITTRVSNNINIKNVSTPKGLVHPANIILRSRLQMNQTNNDTNKTCSSNNNTAIIEQDVPLIPNMDNQTAYVLKSPNVSVLNSPQFAPPVVNPISIESAISNSPIQATVYSDSAKINENEEADKIAKNNLNDVEKNLTKDKEKNCEVKEKVFNESSSYLHIRRNNQNESSSNVTISKKPDSKYISDSHESLNPPPMSTNAHITSNKCTDNHFDINRVGNKFCERKVLSEVQEKQQSLNNEVNERKKGFLIRQIPVPIAKKQSEKDLERLRNKRLAIINRIINHYVQSEPIPLGYDSLQFKKNNCVKERYHKCDIDKVLENTGLRLKLDNDNNNVTNVEITSLHAENECIKDSDNENVSLRQLGFSKTIQMTKNCINEESTLSKPISHTSEDTNSTNIETNKDITKPIVESDFSQRSSNVTQKNKLRAIYNEGKIILNEKDNKNENKEIRKSIETQDLNIIDNQNTKCDTNTIINKNESIQIRKNIETQDLNMIDNQNTLCGTKTINSPLEQHIVGEKIETKQINCNGEMLHNVLEKKTFSRKVLNTNKNTITSATARAINANTLNKNPTKERSKQVSSHESSTVKTYKNIKQTVPHINKPPGIKKFKASKEVNIVEVTELSIGKKDNSKKVLRLKLSNGNVFRATVSGHLKVDLNTILSEPAIKEILSRNNTDMKACTLNVRQIVQTNNSNFPVSIQTYVQDKVQNTTEVIDLISDDEDENIFNFKTEFGNYKVTSNDSEINSKHQWKFNQKCIVQIENCKTLKNIFEMYGKNKDYDENIFKIKNDTNANLTESDISMDEITIPDISTNRNEIPGKSHNSESSVLENDNLNITQKSDSNPYKLLQNQNLPSEIKKNSNNSEFFGKHTPLKKICTVNLVRCDDYLNKNLSVIINSCPIIIKDTSKDYNSIHENEGSCALQSRSDSPSILPNLSSEEDCIRSASPSLIENFGLNLNEIESSNSNRCFTPSFNNVTCNSDWMYTKPKMHNSETMQAECILVKNFKASSDNRDLGDISTDCESDLDTICSNENETECQNICAHGQLFQVPSLSNMTYKLITSNLDILENYVTPKNNDIPTTRVKRKLNNFSNTACKILKTSYDLQIHTKQEDMSEKTFLHSINYNTILDINRIENTCGTDLAEIDKKAMHSYNSVEMKASEKVSDVCSRNNETTEKNPKYTKSLENTIYSKQDVNKIIKHDARDNLTPCDPEVPAIDTKNIDKLKLSLHNAIYTTAHNTSCSNQILVNNEALSNIKDNNYNLNNSEQIRDSNTKVFNDFTSSLNIENDEMKTNPDVIQVLTDNKDHTNNDNSKCKSVQSDTDKQLPNDTDELCRNKASNITFLDNTLNEGNTTNIANTSLSVPLSDKNKFISTQDENNIHTLETTIDIRVSCDTDTDRKMNCSKNMDVENKLSNVNTLFVVNAPYSEKKSNNKETFIPSKIDNEDKIRDAENVNSDNIFLYNLKIPPLENSKNIINDGSLLNIANISSIKNAGLSLQPITNTEDNCDNDKISDVAEVPVNNDKADVLMKSESFNIENNTTNNLQSEIGNSKAGMETICKDSFRKSDNAISPNPEHISDAANIKINNMTPCCSNSDKNIDEIISAATGNIVGYNQLKSTNTKNKNFENAKFVSKAIGEINTNSRISNDIMNRNQITQYDESKENSYKIMGQSLDPVTSDVVQNEISKLYSEETTPTIDKNITTENNILTDCEESLLNEATKDIVSESNKVMLTSPDNISGNNDTTVSNVDISKLINNDSADSNATNRQVPNESVTLVYKGNSDVVLKGSLYEDPVVGTCYIFPLTKTNYTRDGLSNNICDDKTISMIKSFRNKAVDDKNNDAEIDCLSLKIPKITYSKADLTEEENKRNLKRKVDPNNECKLKRKYRKGKNIDYTKQTTKTAYAAEYGRLMAYCSSIKFSYSRPFHKDSLDISSLLNTWPIKGNSCDGHSTSLEENEKIIYLDHDDNNEEFFDPLQQTLAEEIVSEYKEEDKNSRAESQNEILSFNMGFGEGSDRVIQDLENGNETSEFSAATLSDVKLSQPYFTTDDNVYKQQQKIVKSTNEELSMVKRCISFIEMHNKVRNFFSNQTAELRRNLYTKEKHSKKSSFHKREIEGFPYDLLSTAFFEPPRQQTFVNVVQVGQLPVSASAQNPVTCDPRVTPVANASPSQCSAENGPDDDPQSSKTEYTELTTADLSLPLVQDYEHSSQVIMSSQSHMNAPIDSKNHIDVDCDTKVEIKDEIEIKSENENTDLETINGNNINNVSYVYKSDNYSYKSESDYYKCENNSYRHESDSYKSENNSYRHDSDSYNSKNNSYRHDSDSYNSENNSYRQDSDSYKSDNNSYTHESDSYKSENNSYRHDSDYKSENNSYRHETDSYKSENNSYRHDCDSYKSEQNTYNSANNTYKSVNSYKYENNSNKSENNHTLDRESQNAIFDSLLKQENTDYIATPKAHNGTTEKRDQIAHAMTAAGIATTPEPTDNTTEHSLVNVMPQKIRQNTANTTQAQVNNFTKGTPINAMALQQALAQILPPPLNQTNSTENQNSITPQVLHIVQGKNAPGNPITIVENQQNSVINSTNNAPVLHIVQNKSAIGGSTTSSNTAATQHTNTFSGLSLVDAGLQQGGNQLLHIVNTGNQKNNTSGQLLKRVNLLTNLTNVQGAKEQKMVQFVCKSADGKSIQLNAPHQRSMVLRLQPIESPNVPNTPKSENQDLSPTQNFVSTITTKETNNTQQQEIKSRSVYEENYAKFIQNSSAKTTLPEKSTSLPKFNQAFGKQVYQDSNQKTSEITSSNGSHLPNANNSTENVECPSNDSAMNMDHMNQINSPPLLLRKSPPQTSQPQQVQTNLVQQIKQTIAPMNIQTMHGGVIYTRQIPVNIGGGQTINLITVPSTDLIDENGQKQQGDVKFVSQNDIESSIIKIVPQTQVNTSSESSEENNTVGGTSETTQTHSQPVLTQMRIKLPMLSKTPQMVSGTRLVRPSFFQIQRNVIGGANQPVYQQLVLTAAPSLGQQQIRPQAQTSRPVKTNGSNQSSEAQMSSSTLEQLREFDMVLEQVKERSTVQPNSNTSNSNAFTKLQTSTETSDNTTPISVITTEAPQQVLYSIGNTHSLNVAYVNRKPSASTPTTSTFVRSPDSSGGGVADSPTSSTHVPMPHTSSTETSSDTSPQQSQSKPKSSSKSKSRPKTSSNPSTSMKINTVAPKTSSQKPLEDEQTTQRILYILAEYKEQVENSPDKDKPAPRRRTHPPSNPGSSKRKKSSSGSRKHGRDMSPIHGEDTCRTMGSEDSSCGTSQGDCSENCFETHSPQDSPRKVVRKLTFENENAPNTAPRPQPARNVIVADGQTITVARGTAGKPATAVLMPANYILPVSMVKGGQQIAIVTNRGPKILTVGGEGGTTNALLLQRLIGPAGLKPVLARPGVRHVRLPTAALHNLQAFNLATATVQPPDSTASPAPAHTPPDLVETRVTSSPWPDRDQDVKPERGSSPEGSEPWHLQSSADPHDYSYEETVRSENMDRTVLVVQKRDSRQHRLTHMSAALRHKYAILEHELHLQKSLSEECEDLGVDSPSAAELFPEAELLFASSPAPESSHHAHTPQPGISQTTIPQPDLDDQIATDQLLSRQHLDEDLEVLGLDEGIVTVTEDGRATITLDQEEFARSHPNTTFHSEPTEEDNVQPYTITGFKGRHITSTIFHAGRAPATVLMAPHTTVISQAGPESNIKYIDNVPGHNNICLSSVLVKDDGLTRYDVLNDSRELHLSHTASAIVHSNAAQVIRRVCYEDDKRDRFLLDETDALIAGDDAKMIAEDSSRDATLESIADDRSSPERHVELFWESNSASERSDSRRPLDFSSDSDKCCKSPLYDETNSTDSSGVGTHMRLDSVIKDARGLDRSGSADNSSADDTLPPLRTYPPKRMYHIDGEMERSVSGKTRAGERERSPDGHEVRRRTSVRGVVKRGCHCCNGSPAPPRPKKSRPKKANIEFSNN